MREELRQKPNPISFDDRRAFDSFFVIQKALLGGQARKADIDAGLCRIAVGIRGPNLLEPDHRVIQEDHVNVVMVPLPGAEFSKRASFHCGSGPVFSIFFGA